MLLLVLLCEQRVYNCVKPNTSKSFVYQNREMDINATNHSEESHNPTDPHGDASVYLNDQDHGTKKPPCKLTIGLSLRTSENGEEKVLKFLKIS